MPIVLGALLALSLLASTNPVRTEPPASPAAPPPADVAALPASGSAPVPAASPDVPSSRAANPSDGPAPPPGEAPPPVPVATLVRAAFAVEPGARLRLSPSAEVVVDPASSFEIELAARMTDARLVLVDGQGDLVPASEVQEIGATTRLTLKPAIPLSPGSRYAVRIDGATGREVRDDAGRAFAPLVLPIVAAGTPPPPEPKPAAKRRRSTRR